MLRIRRKLKSDSGSSIILAMALMLICVMVSSVILAAATSNANRNYDRVSQHQNYLAVSDAVGYITSHLDENIEFVGVEKSGIKPCDKYKNAKVIDGHYVIDYAPETDTLEESCYILDELHTEEAPVYEVDGMTHFTGPFATLMETASLHVYEHKATYTENFTLKVTDISLEKDERIPEVNCKFTMDEEYYITIEVSSASPESIYRVRIEMEPSVSYGEHRENVTCTHEISYTVLREDGVETKIIPDYEFVDSVYFEETHVTWGKPVVTKEVDAQ